MGGLGRSKLIKLICLKVQPVLSQICDIWPVSVKDINKFSLHNSDFFPKDLEQNGVLLCSHLILQISLVHLLHVFLGEVGLHVHPGALLLGQVYGLLPILGIL